jgi:hypothetical protein
LSDETIRIRILFADSGTFHHEDLTVPRSSISGYDRLIDGLREDESFLKQAYLDLGRLCAAWVLQEAD